MEHEQTNPSAAQMAIIAAHWEVQQAQIAKDRLRQHIDATADIKTREGVMSDVLAYLLVQQANTASAISKATTIADVKAAFAEQAKIGQILLDKIAVGELVLPYRAKGLDGSGILADLVRVSNGVSAALAVNAGQSAK